MKVRRRFERWFQSNRGNFYPSLGWLWRFLKDSEKRSWGSRVERWSVEFFLNAWSPGG
jgi:hypothetical protein